MAFGKLSVLLVLLAATARLAIAQTLEKKPIRYSDLPPELREILGKQGVAADGFADFVRSIDERTVERERAGETDHLIYFLLQSSVFTHQPKIEPAVSAREFVSRLAPEERTRYLLWLSNYLPPAEKTPGPVARRMDDFIGALNRPSSDERLVYFKDLLKRRGNSPEPFSRLLRAEYARSMRFLYLKEFAAKDVNPTDKGAFLASLYQDRGHSTDTRAEANFAIWTGLSVLKALNPGLRLDRVMIVGPGLDFSPRTELIDALRPQSYQPYAVADALLGLGLSTPDRLRVHCVDINESVIHYLNEFPKRKTRKITVVSTLREAPRNSLAPDYKSYLEKLGRNIGAEASPEGLPASRGSYVTKAFLVHKDVADRITAEPMNILTERYEPSPGYDLVVVTNVFVYFNASELLLSLSNIHSMMKEGGYLLHNEFRPELESLSRALRLVPIQARTVQLSSGNENPMLDGFVIHRKEL